MDIITSSTLVTLPPTESELSERLKQFVNERGAFSDNTWREIVAAFKRWGRFATSNGMQILPALPADVKLFILEMDRQGLASSSIKAYVTRLNILHVNAGLEPPNADAGVKRVLRQVSRQAVVAGETQGQAVPFRSVDLDVMISLWDGSSDQTQLRDLAFLSVAYNTLLRESEVLRIKVKDVTFTPKGAIIKVGHTKTTLNATGIIKHLQPRTARHLKNWLETSGLIEQKEMCVFCWVHGRSKRAVPTDKPMTHANANKIFQRAYEATHEQKHEGNKGRYFTFTGHSARVGAAMDMLDADISLEKIMLEGNWSSPAMVLHYLRHALAEQSVMSELIPD